MQVYPNRFAQTLSQQLPMVCLIFGDEPQQKLDCMEALRERAKKEGFDERYQFVADGQFNWNDLIDACQSMSLFSSRQHIELELPTGKPGAEGSKVLTSLAQQPNPDVLLTIHGPKIGKDVQNSKWFKQLDKSGCYVPCYPLEGKQLSAWLDAQMREAGIKNSRELVGFFQDYFEGNMPAAKQEIRKLPLLYPSGTIDPKAVSQVIVDQSRFNVFQLQDVILSGNGQKVVKMLNRLESEGVEPTIVLWALVQEWQKLSQLQGAQQVGQQLASIWPKLKIWKNRQNLYLNALQRLSTGQLKHIQQKLQCFDTALKSGGVQRPYIELCHLCLLFVPMALTALPLAGGNEALH